MSSSTLPMLLSDTAPLTRSPISRRIASDSWFIRSDALQVAGATLLDRQVAQEARHQILLPDRARNRQALFVEGFGAPRVRTVGDRRREVVERAGHAGAIAGRAVKRAGVLEQAGRFVAAALAQDRGPLPQPGGRHDQLRALPVGGSRGRARRRLGLLEVRQRFVAAGLGQLEPRILDVRIALAEGVDAWPARRAPRPTQSGRWPGAARARCRRGRNWRASARSRWPRARRCPFPDTCPPPAAARRAPGRTTAGTPARRLRGHGRRSRGWTRCEPAPRARAGTSRRPGRRARAGRARPARRTAGAGPGPRRTAVWRPTTPAATRAPTASPPAPRPR